MLILTRRVGERLMIDDEIMITVCAVRGNQVRIGIDAKKTIIVDREEVWSRKKIEEQQKLLEEKKESHGK